MNRKRGRMVPIAQACQLAIALASTGLTDEVGGCFEFRRAFVRPIARPRRTVRHRRVHRQIHVLRQRRPSSPLSRIRAECFRLAAHKAFHRAAVGTANPSWAYFMPLVSTSARIARLTCSSSVGQRSMMRARTGSSGVGVGGSVGAGWWAFRAPTAPDSAPPVSESCACIGVFVLSSGSGATTRKMSRGLSHFHPTLPKVFNRE